MSPSSTLFGMRWKAAMLLVLVLTGCTTGSEASSSTSDEASAETTATVSASTQASPAAQLEATKSPTVIDALTGAGIDCNGQQMVGDVDCTSKGQLVTVSMGAWADSEALRRKACDAGYVNPGYVVAVGSGYSVSADQNATAQAIAKDAGLQVVTYCPK